MGFGVGDGVGGWGCRGGEKRGRLAPHAHGRSSVWRPAVAFVPSVIHARLVCTCTATCRQMSRAQTPLPAAALCRCTPTRWHIACT